MGFAATAGLRAGALRTAAFRAGFLAVLRAEVLRAVARFAAVFRAGAFFFKPVFLAFVLRALVFFAPARRALALLVALRFFPLVFVAMACAPLLLWLPHSTAQMDVLARITLHWSSACRPTERVNGFFSLYDDRE
jgi:hypothetical protein